MTSVPKRYLRKRLLPRMSQRRKKSLAISCRPSGSLLTRPSSERCRKADRSGIGRILSVATDFRQRGSGLIGEEAKDGPFRVAAQLVVDREEEADCPVVGHLFDGVVEITPVEGAPTQELDLVGVVAALAADVLDLVVAEARVVPSPDSWLWRMSCRAASSSRAPIASGGVNPSRKGEVSSSVWASCQSRCSTPAPIGCRPSSGARGEACGGWMGPVD